MLFCAAFAASCPPTRLPLLVGSSCDVTSSRKLLQAAASSASSGGGSSAAAAAASAASGAASAASAAAAAAGKLPCSAFCAYNPSLQILPIRRVHDASDSCHYAIHKISSLSACSSMLSCRCLVGFLCSLTASQGVLAAGSNTVSQTQLFMSAAMLFTGTLFTAACL